MPRPFQPSLPRSLFAAFLLVLAVLSAATAARRQSPGAIRGFLPTRVAAERSLEQKLQSIPDPAHAEADLRHLTAEPHMAGTEASRRVAVWLRAQYRRFGFDADIVSYSVWLPLPREVHLELVAPDKAVLGSREQPFAGDPDSSDPRAVGGFNSYSPSADITAPVVYANYGAEQDYADLESFGVSAAGKIVLVRYGRNYRGVKARIAEEHKAVGLLIYSDPQDDGYVAGDTYPLGPWRPLSAIQRGSVLYTQIYPGDPLTPGAPSVPATKRIAPADAASLPHIPTLPINAQDASVILSHLGGDHVPREWQGGLPLTYHLGPGDAQLHLKLVIDYQQRPIYDVVARLRGANDNQWVILGNHHDAWVFGAADPGSGTAALLEAARALGNLARSGWKPRRTIVICNWDAEEPGLIGSTEWVEANLAALQQKAVAYINTDVGVTGSNFSASATPSLDQLVRDVARDTKDPSSGRSLFDVWRDRLTRPQTSAEIPESDTGSDALVELPLGALGAGSDFCPFFDHAGIPSLDVSFTGDYGVYHSLYDDFYWMKRFGDPTFDYHAALARVLGTLALRLDEADILPFNYPEYAVEIARAGDDLAARATLAKLTGEGSQTVSEASALFSVSAQRAAQALRSMSPDALDPAKEDAINRGLVTVEQQFLDPRGLFGRPWYEHTVFAPGTYAGYAAEVMPGLSEALDSNDPVMFQQEAASLAAALRRAAARLDDVTRLAGSAAPSATSTR